MAQHHNMEDTKERVLRHALSEFLKKGVKNVKVDDVANDLQISKRTLYELFTDKENLLVECLGYHNELMSHEVAEIAASSGNPLEVYVKFFRLKMKELRDMSPAFFSEVKRYGRAMDFFKKEAVKRNAKTLEFIHACVEAGLFRKDVDFKLLITLVDMLDQMIMEQEIYKDYTMEHIATTLSDTFMRGICTAEGLKVMKS